MSLTVNGGTPIASVAQAAATLSLSGVPTIGDTWNIVLTPSTGSPPPVNGSFLVPGSPAPTIGAVAGDLRADLDTGGFVALRQTDAGGIERLTVTRIGGGAFTTAGSITPAGSSSLAAATARKIALTGPGERRRQLSRDGRHDERRDARRRDVGRRRRRRRGGAGVEHNGADIDELSGYTAFALGGALYVTKLPGPTLTLATAIARDPAAALPAPAGCAAKARALS